MNAKRGNEYQSTQPVAADSTPEFNFEVWAKQVRPLLLASLNKRGNRY
ncbi:hypothetical protein J5X98_24305 [Leptothermofonsia sichuanensis E412]|jgi:hypothetical protein|nr:hypothetical protein [Leptothermofonsia sichuanensis]QZZ20345.1 hypothetical protein J5X98_24305 [Leptothermofonsia sichuanensis E412]